MNLAVQPMPYDTTGLFPMPKLHEDLRLTPGKAILLGVLIEGLMLGVVAYLFSREDTAKPPLRVTELIEMVPLKKIETIQPEPKPQSVAKPSPPRVQPIPAPPIPTPIAKNTAPSPIAIPPAEPPPPAAPPANAAPTPPQPVTPVPSKPVLDPPPTSGNSDIVALNRSKPNYPRRAAQAGIEGWVKLSFTVAADGKVNDIKILDANPPRLFDAEAKRAIQEWTFKPRNLDGKPVEGTAVQTVEFKLNEY